ncbi:MULTISPECIES: efflux RND transporter periplasmic adaptor subunit [unclassified Salipiger]|uniref:efflux RND transporter periplasmic adaptor subunit n=1 Tax=unclassified Salipiger TaxID=2640570 RepID=UPI0013BC9027|nr:MULTISPECIES: efflux RND transporter periplasmic adaptor subunit [unclassified Salipiger]NDV51034.1 efflux RND transporter periplasmic adaptor subunit [Salipiger sp. PrR003]NDW33910.1 efflux RND transporter periplasmic adaptor subunit [Salipiger sp. PrR007]
MASSRTPRTIRVLVAAFALTLPQADLLHAQDAPPAARAAREVGVITLEASDVPYSVTLPGRSTAFEEVAIRPRVSGVISEILYEPGSDVTKGEVLFRIDGDTYQADVDAAEADVAGAEAALRSAGTTLSRYQKLVGTGVTAADVDAAEVDVMQAKATLSAAQAALELAKLDLERTEITSPIDGIAVLPEVSVGDLVTANQEGALTTVTRIDPIYVDVQESITRVQQTRERLAQGSLNRGARIEAELELENGSMFEGQGTFVSPPVSVSTTTGTSVIRLRFDNPRRGILPGQFLRVKLTFGTTPSILVPQGATSRASDGTLTAFVAADGKAEKRTLAAQGSYNNAWVVTEGVEIGEQLIVDGLRNLQRGAAVSPIDVVISETGVVTRADGAPDSFGAAPEPAADTRAKG